MRVFEGIKQISEHPLKDLPCAIVGFHTENDEPRSAALAVGGSSSVFIFKNMRPYFKYCLPSLIANQEEQEVRKFIY